MRKTKPASSLRMRIARRLARAIRQIPGVRRFMGPGPDSNTVMVETIDTIEGLDRKLRELDEAHKISDDAMRAVFQTFSMKYPNDIPSDPYSRAYHEYVFSLYSKISGRTYEISNESSNFDISGAVARPFPFYTKSSRTVGDQLIMIGNLIKLLSAPAGASLLEFGPAGATPRCSSPRWAMT
jgi:hypothetical protein